MGDSVVFGASSKEADIRDKLRSGRDGFRTGTGFGERVLGERKELFEAVEPQIYPKIWRGNGRDFSVVTDGFFGSFAV
ncbi:MAG: hypothetical protein RIS92_713 [Verrucomicrobiota bacterium]